MLPASSPDDHSAEEPNPSAGPVPGGAWAGGMRCRPRCGPAPRAVRVRPLTARPDRAHHAGSRRSPGRGPVASIPASRGNPGSRAVLRARSRQLARTPSLTSRVPSGCLGGRWSATAAHGRVSELGSGEQVLVEHARQRMFFRATGACSSGPWGTGHVPRTCFAQALDEDRARCRCGRFGARADQTCSAPTVPPVCGELRGACGSALGRGSCRRSRATSGRRCRIRACAVGRATTSAHEGLKAAVRAEHAGAGRRGRRRKRCLHVDVSRRVPSDSVDAKSVAHRTWKSCSASI